MESFVVCKNCAKLVRLANTKHFMKCIGPEQTTLNIRRAYDGGGNQPSHIVVRMVVTQ